MRRTLHIYETYKPVYIIAAALHFRRIAAEYQKLRIALLLIQQSGFNSADRFQILSFLQRLVVHGKSAFKIAF